MAMRQATDDKVLMKRLDRFLTSSSLGGPDIGRVIEPLGRIGQVLIFGGALRDIALEGNSRFPNDIDIVVRTDDIDALFDLMLQRSAIRNRFGGYRFAAAGWKFDVWAFQDTWAFRAGFVAGADANDLLKTTFFDWDAIAYDVVRRRLIFRESYFERIAHRVVDINLIENPNPRGAAVRALKIFMSGKAKLSARLARYVLEVIRLPQPATTGFAESQSAWIDRATGELDARLKATGKSPVGFESEQLRLTS